MYYIGTLYLYNTIITINSKLSLKKVKLNTYQFTCLSKIIDFCLQTYFMHLHNIQ